MALHQRFGFFAFVILLSFISQQSLIYALSTQDHDQMVLQPHTPPLDLSESSNRDLVMPDWSALDLYSETSNIAENFTSIITPALHFILPALTFIVDHPWILAVLLAPAMDGLLIIMGFSSELGIIPNSFASKLQSYIGNVPKNSLFSFFQKHGKRRYGMWALKRGGIWLIAAVVFVTIATILIENSVGEEKVEFVLEKIWNGTVAKWGEAPGAWFVGRDDMYLVEGL
ncbi:hypothetical protein BJ508DRAFT_412475 [Ascobolus immersus RN42]|uniref:Uncharacterized protein n=1 Tax=Ascobolus immersus RN42 TaxID=1160509 RepID=A0A3N4IKQ6_ASCIM|nr:hypothetical protein BJ508DRAFT_412475 [Ascobolus immersus RN42]